MFSESQIFSLAMFYLYGGCYCVSINFLSLCNRSVSESSTWLMLFFVIQTRDLSIMKCQIQLKIVCIGNRSQSYLNSLNSQTIFYFIRKTKQTNEIKSNRGQRLVSVQFFSLIRAKLEGKISIEIWYWSARIMDTRFITGGKRMRKGVLEMEISA